MAKNVIIALLIGIVIGFCSPAKSEGESTYALERAMTKAMLNYLAVQCISIGQTRKGYVEEKMKELGY